ncbi:AAR085Wp [Eremothecium gossypii ATCC 10895]|uniref:AAR085Wp n=1 Tax=Eremothecium gossypii (strain ATCC 10895 / CBS 109.51 / FGSC 9923 / NRRL Y-1056) TaxID=284811 RepID=Q75EJ4_EREGS|nr:AAR085Wp [Eremothecium gossypii ATCC 10895]AAS50450.1 AAR085Wp [Eremothecium gossypii ATCC 10895]AEY94736.1 FAAR085Wp [Eremothecium gossypii FDAG1]
MELVRLALGAPVHPLIGEQLVPFLRRHGVVRSEEMLSHMHLVIYVALFYHCCYLVGKHMLFPGLVRWRRAVAPQRLLVQSAIHWVSLVQSVVILTLCYASWPLHTRATHPRPEDRVFATTPVNSVLASFALGYFLWDTVISLRHSSVAFALHGAVSTVVFLIGMTPYINYYAGMFLLFELSNPFLNGHWFARHYLPLGSQTHPHAGDARLVRWSARFALANDLVFFTVFFCARIAYGYYKIGELALDFYRVRADPRFMPYGTAFILGGNLVLNVLNAIWFRTMVCMARDQLYGKRSAAAEQKRAT